MEGNAILKGVTVVELATAVAAPMTAKVLADFGATVIKIESPKGDDMRQQGKAYYTPTDDVNHNNPLFTVYNSGKKMTCLDLKTERGMEVLHKILCTADVFLTNVRPASLMRLGLSYEEIKHRYPRLIYAQFTSYGSKGEDKDKGGFDVCAFWARNGPLIDWLTSGDQPLRPSYAFGDMASGGYFLSGILMALMRRNATGEGSYVESSLLANGVWMSACALIAGQPQYGNPLQCDWEHPLNPFGHFYQCADGKFIGIFVKNYKADYPLFAKALGLEDVISDPRYTDMDVLQKTGTVAEATARIAAAMKGRPHDEWEKIFDKYDLVYGVVNSAKDIYQDKQVIANEYLYNVEFGDGTVTSLPYPPILISGNVRSNPPPCGNIGEHTAEVLLEYGYSQAEIEAITGQIITEGLE